MELSIRKKKKRKINLCMSPTAARKLEGQTLSRYYADYLSYNVSVKMFSQVPKNHTTNS